MKEMCKLTQVFLELELYLFGATPTGQRDIMIEIVGPLQKIRQCKKKGGSLEFGLEEESPIIKMSQVITIYLAQNHF